MLQYMLEENVMLQLNRDGNLFVNGIKNVNRWMTFLSSMFSKAECHLQSGD